MGNLMNLFNEDEKEEETVVEILGLKRATKTTDLLNIMPVKIQLMVRARILLKVLVKVQMKALVVVLMTMEKDQKDLDQKNIMKIQIGILKIKEDILGIAVEKMKFLVKIQMRVLAGVQMTMEKDLTRTLKFIMEIQLKFQMRVLVKIQKMVLMGVQMTRKKEIVQDLARL